MPRWLKSCRRRKQLGGEDSEIAFQPLADLLTILNKESTRLSLKALMPRYFFDIQHTGYEVEDPSI
jgi:hypothetical protein